MRCDYCRADATTVLEYRTKRWPRGNTVLAKNGCCDEHASCVGWTSLVEAVHDRQPRVYRVG